MIVPPDMGKIKNIADQLECDIKVLEKKLKETECKNKICELQAEIRNKGLILFNYQRTLSSRKYKN